MRSRRFREAIIAAASLLPSDGAGTFPALMPSLGDYRAMAGEFATSSAPVRNTSGLDAFDVAPRRKSAAFGRA